MTQKKHLENLKNLKLPNYHDMTIEIFDSDTIRSPNIGKIGQTQNLLTRQGYISVTNFCPKFDFLNVTMANGRCGFADM